MSRRVSDWRQTRDSLVSERCGTFFNALNLATAMLQWAMLRRPGPSRARLYTKDDGTMVTDVDQSINDAVMGFIKRLHPDDSVIGEESVSASAKEAVVKWHIDPVDNTNHFYQDDFKKPDPYRWVAVMMSLSVYNTHLMFGLSYPVLRETYYGCWNMGIFRNGRAYSVPSRQTGLLVGLNEESHQELLYSATGYRQITIANLEGYVILQGLAEGGWSQFNKLHEHGCLTALIRCIPQTSITDMMGNDHQSGNDLLLSQSAVWSRQGSPFSHDDILSMAWAKQQRMSQKL